MLGNPLLAAVAGQAGYESEAAFIGAFKREFGMPPASWRKSSEPAMRTAGAAHMASP